MSTWQEASEKMWEKTREAMIANKDVPVNDFVTLDEEGHKEFMKYVSDLLHNHKGPCIDIYVL